MRSLPIAAPQGHETNWQRLRGDLVSLLVAKTLDAGKTRQTARLTQGVLSLLNPILGRR